MVSFIELPQDIVIAIYAYITPEDLLSLNQTCRALHDMGCIDYVWQQLDCDLPLDIYQDSGAQTHYNHHAMRQSLVNALKVEANWRDKDTRIRDLITIKHGDIIDQVQLLRDDWLITLSRNSTTETAYLSIWNVKKDINHPFTSMRIDHSGKTFSAAVRRDGVTAIIALCYPTSMIRVFTLALNDEYLDNDPTASPLQIVSELNLSRSSRAIQSLIPTGAVLSLFTEVQVNDNIVAGLITKLGLTTEPRFELVIINIETGVCTRLNINSNQTEDVNSTEFYFKLCPEHVVCISSSDTNGLLYAHDVSHISCSAEESLKKAERQSLGQLCDVFNVEAIPLVDQGRLPGGLGLTSPLLSKRMDIRFSYEPMSTSCKTISFLSYHLQRAYLFRFPLTKMTTASIGPTTIEVKPLLALEIPNGFSIDFASLGQSGYRMIWSIRDWNEDTFSPMKTTFPRAGKEDSDLGLVANELLPPHVVLPFETRKYNAVWFQEATGRMCWALYTGELYILKI